MAGPTRGRPRPAERWRSADEHHRARSVGDTARAPGEPRPVHAPGRRERARRRDDRPGTHRPPSARHRRVRPRQVHRHPHVHRCVRHREGRHELLRRHPLGPLRPQTRAGRRLDHRHPCPAAADVGPDVELGGVRQRPARSQPRAHLVDHRDHEDRPRRPGTPRVRDGPQRGRRLRGRRHHRPGHRLDRRRTRPAPRAVLPRSRLRRARSRPVHTRRERDPGTRPT